MSAGVDRGDPSGQDERIVGETVHARGDDGWRWVGPPLRMAMECQRENTGMDVPVFLIWGVGPLPPPSTLRARVLKERGLFVSKDEELGKQVK